MNYEARNGPFATPEAEETTERIISPRERIDAGYLQMIHREAALLASVLREHGWNKEKYENFVAQKDFLAAIFFLGDQSDIVLKTVSALSKKLNTIELLPEDRVWCFELFSELVSNGIRDDEDTLVDG